MFLSYSRQLRAGLAVAGLSLLWVGSPISAREEARSPDEEARSSDAAGGAGQGSEAADPLEGAREIRRRGNREGIAAQKRINEISAETEKLFARYTTALRQLDSVNAYNRRMDELVASQEEHLASVADQLERVQEVGRSVMPLMLRMIDALEAFVELDVPFLPEERRTRVAKLRSMMARSDVSNAEKYRQIMQAYQIENEYGRTIEAYRGALEREGREITVDFLRFGRIALVYQTLDGDEMGVWNQRTRSWETLDASYRSAVRHGLRIARKQAAPDLVTLPLLRPVDAGGEG